MLSIFGISKNNSQAQNINFSDGWNVATQKFIQNNSDSLDFSIDTIFITKPEDIVGKNLAFYDLLSKQISASYLKIDSTFEEQAIRAASTSPISHKYKILKSGAELTNAEILGYLIHELRHRRNAEINMFGLDFDQLVEFAFWDEVSARVAELLLRRQAYLQTGSHQEAFTGVMFDTIEKDVFTGIAEESIGYKNRMFKLYGNYLDDHNIDSIPSQKEAKKILEYAVSGLIDNRNDQKLYVQTIPSLSQYRLFKTPQSYLLHYNGAPNDSPVTSWDIVMSQLFDFDDINIWDLCGASHFEKQTKKFQKIKAQEDYAQSITKLGASYQESIDKFSALLRTTQINKMEK
ncbi:MAG: hypothetical protein LBF37_00835 [Rickettsiales bacterium]|nr:hypothetical protein [Rickettsiales bacterium]